MEAGCRQHASWVWLAIPVGIGDRQYPRSAEPSIWTYQPAYGQSAPWPKLAMAGKRSSNFEASCLAVSFFASSQPK